MLRSETLFGKRDTPTPTPAPAAPATSPLSSAVQPPISSPKSTLSNPVTNNSLNSSAPGSAPGAGLPASSQSSTASTNEMGSKLIVGPNIKLKGVEITDCDTLVVEGNVEATMDSRVMQIAEGGEFKGTAEVDFAEINGTFNGELTVREKLIIHTTGKVTGKIRYGKLVITEGGQVSGDIQVVGSAQAKSQPAASPTAASTAAPAAPATAPVGQPAFKAA
jgi:cytoskeletal protein CcmA (bactofilin family)